MATKKTTKRHRLNPVQIKKLFKKLKSIQAVATKIKASYMGTRRVLIAQKLYKA